MSDRVHPPKRDATINALMSLMLNKLHALPNAPPCYFTLLGSWLARMCLPALGWASIDAAGQLPRAPALLARLSHRHRCPHRVHVPVQVLYPVPQTETPDCLWCARERGHRRENSTLRARSRTPPREARRRPHIQMASSSSLDPLIHVTVSQAVSGRSSCQVCKEKILDKSMRVGLPGKNNGISCTKWCHPDCFADSIFVFDYAPTGRAKCSLSGRDIAKGEMRLNARKLNCQGKVATNVIYHPPAAAGIVQEVLMQCTGGASVVSLCARIEDAQACAWARDAISGVDVSARPVPMNAQSDDAKPAKKVAAKRAAQREELDQEQPAQKQPRAKKRANAVKPQMEEQVQAEEDDDGEVCD